MLSQFHIYTLDDSSFTGQFRRRGGGWESGEPILSNHDANEVQ
jgi:hypothetical protein